MHANLYRLLLAFLVLAPLAVLGQTAPADVAQNAALEAMFKERAKCAVEVEYIIQAEENRERVFAQGIVADNSGLVILPAGAIPSSLPPKMLKDFKLYTPDGSGEGVKCKYLGCDRLYQFHYLRTENGKLPEGAVAYTNFKIGQFKMTQPLWGVALLGEEHSFDAAFLCANVSYISKDPILSAITSNGVSGNGGPVFNGAGEFVGMASGPMRDYKVLYFRDGKSIPVAIGENWASNSVVGVEHIKEALTLIPSKPEGDPVATLGVLDSQPTKREVAKFLGLGKDGNGIVIGDVVEGSPAQKAGLKKGDIIVGFDGRKYKTTKPESAIGAVFAFDILRKSPEDKAIIKIIPAGQTEQKDVEVTFAPSPKSVRQAHTQYFKRLGFSVREMVFDDACARRILNYTTTGAIVRWVKPNSPAASALPKGVFALARIKEINSQPVKDYAQAVEILGKIDADKSAKELVIVLEDTKETSVSRIKLD